ncbi:MAG TPA: alpha/beta hydrolase [Thermoanaerobaculia bacterium]|nr:alpha/beta hydrolase [Thermoanaerobaculia bacterium]
MLVASLLLGAAGTGASTAVNRPAPAAPCTVAGRSARCALLEVPEDRAAPQGRTLPIRVVVLPATDAAERLDDPLVVLEGGPGASVIAALPMHAATFAGLQRRRDLLFVEQRGTGESGALDCGLEAMALQSEQAAAECRERLAGSHDLRFYGTHHAVLDLTDAFEALGYKRVNVFGVSYGTRTALELVRRRPEGVRTVALLGTYPPGRNGVLDAPRILDRTLALLVEACAADASCHQAYPRLAESIESLDRRLGTGELDVSRLEVASALRLMLFYPIGVSQAPRVLTSAAAGDLAPLRAISAGIGVAFAGITGGAFLSLLCSEDVARLDRSQLERASRGTLLGPAWGDQLIGTCGPWPSAEVPGDFHAPLEIAVPLLSLTGELDPSMPPSWGAELAAALPGALHATIPEAPHGLLGMRGVACVVGMIESFVESGTVRGLDVSCLDEIRRPPFSAP